MLINLSSLLDKLCEQLFDYIEHFVIYLPIEIIECIQRFIRTYSIANLSLTKLIKTCTINYKVIS